MENKRKDRKFPELKLNEEIFTPPKPNDTQPVLVIQSPKTPTLSRKLKAVSLDSDAGQKRNLDLSRDVSSVPNTPKKLVKPKEPIATNYDFVEPVYTQKSTLTPYLCSNLKRFASNTSISSSQTLKTLPEIMTLTDCTGVKVEPVRIKAKGLLERRGSNASLTIDLGSNTNLAVADQTRRPIARLNTAKSVSNLNLTSFGFEKCVCLHKCQKVDEKTTKIETQKNCRETCGNCTIYESIPSTNKKLHHPKHSTDHFCKCTLKFLPRYYIERHCVCNTKCRRKSLSNENLYVPPCNFCHFGSKDCHFGGRTCNRGSRKALYPRQTYIETSQLLSEDFKLHLQNVQYLQTAGSVLSVAELKSCCQMDKIPRLHQEFWEVPLNLQEKCLVSGSQSRNRYKGVLPNEHSRVHLPGPQSYIHANYIKGSDYTETAYIATQGPMSHTCEDFWTMAWNNKVEKIVMLTGLIERSRNKCELYFPLGEDTDLSSVLNPTQPQTGNEKLYYSQDSYDEEPYLIELEQKNSIEWGPYTIKYLSKEQFGECTIRKLELSQSATEKRTILHYWYQNWADHKLANPEQVLQIALHVLELDSSRTYSATDSSSSADPILNSSSSSELDPDDRFKFEAHQNSLNDNKPRLKFNFEPKTATKFSFDQECVKSPLIVHCSAGIGRTGCFLAILNGIQQLRTNYNVDILAIVCSLRLNRGGMVQTAEQYELIHRVLSLYADFM